eukprot:48709-Prymnesium_polylepis.1
MSVTSVTPSSELPMARASRGNPTTIHRTPLITRITRSRHAGRDARAPAPRLAESRHPPAAAAPPRVQPRMHASSNSCK